MDFLIKGKWEQGILTLVGLIFFPLGMTLSAVLAFTLIFQHQENGIPFLICASICGLIGWGFHKWADRVEARSGESLKERMLRYDRILFVLGTSGCFGGIFLSLLIPQYLGIILLTGGFVVMIMIVYYILWYKTQTKWEEEKKRGDSRMNTIYQTDQKGESCG